MKVIDLLNKIANNEEIPKQVKYKNYYWKYIEEAKDYKDNEDDYVFSCSNYDIPEMLDNEVEIIEEDKEIKKIKQYYDKDLDEYVVETYINGINYKEIYKSRYDEMMIKKISELIDEVNKLKRGE